MKNQKAEPQAKAAHSAWILQTDENDIFVEVVDSATEGKVIATFPADEVGYTMARQIVADHNAAPETAAERDRLRDALTDATECCQTVVNIMHEFGDPKRERPFSWKDVCLQMYAVMQNLPKYRSALSGQPDTELARVKESEARLLALVTLAVLTPSALETATWQN